MSTPIPKSETSATPDGLQRLKIAVLISGGGTTLKNLIQKIDQRELPLEIVHVISTNCKAGGLQIAEGAGISTELISRFSYTDIESFSAAIFESCRQVGAQLVVMGGFLKQVQVPADFENRVMNIHPSLIPSFCGAGFFGLRVHEAAIQHGVKLSGCTIHFVDDHYDHGPIIAQEAVPVQPDDTPERLAARVFAVECELYPAIITAYAEGRVHVDGRRVFVAPK